MTEESPDTLRADEAAARQVWEEPRVGWLARSSPGGKLSGPLHVSSVKSSHGSYCAAVESALRKKVVYREEEGMI